MSFLLTPWFHSVMALDSLMGVGLRPLPGLAPPLVFIERHPDHQANHADAHCNAKESNRKHGEYCFNHVFSFGGISGQGIQYSGW
jgi:hypothetical protein